MTRVQVVIPTYNYARFLPASVGSVLSQAGVDIDLLIIDNCSTDETPEVCAALAAADSRVRVIRHAVNEGHIYSINEGISQIRGDYFLLLCADDLLTEGALARATAVLDENPSVGMVYGQVICLYGETPPPARTRMTGTSIWPGREWMQLVCNSGKNFILSPEAVVRTRIQQQVGGYNPKLPRSADMEQWLRIAAVSDIARVKGADQGYYRVHGASMSSTAHTGPLFDLESRRDAFRSAFEKEAGALVDAGEMHRTANRALATIALWQARKVCLVQRTQDEPCDELALIEAYRSFARSLDPDIVTSRRWKALARALCPGTMTNAFARYSAGIAGVIEREIGDRLEYHWTRRTGIRPPRPRPPAPLA